ncbi:hypothetical protein [Chryseobacterium sp. Hurlbut01]|uniref:hypothetical protein n=1 Tax=Chryseobacterium sp. Hurlbut01 TaxID=1681828 RepID=UPI00067D87F1|nr:hypothetical protein [Chryseobacterium sp. Hurlbut01]KNB63186.1 hypothetical protein AC804_00880 [Chryseobacterium sp. Hurlbut01]
MNSYIKTLVMLGFMSLSYRANAQLDTLQLLKKVEINQKHYIGKSFSKLLKDLKKLSPEKYYTTYNCVYESQFFFSKDDKNKYKMTITWDYSMMYKAEVLKNTNKLNIFDKKTEHDYKNLIVNSIKIANNEDVYFISYDGGALKKYEDPYIYLNESLEREKRMLYDEPFHYFICWLQRRYMKIFEVENITDKKDPNKISQSIFHIKNSFDKSAKVVVDWDSPISKKQIKRYEKTNGNTFNNDERNLYTNKIVKDIMFYR